MSEESKTDQSEMMRYLIVIEKTQTGFSAYSPDIPGCITTGTTREETTENMKEAISFHLEGLKLEGESLPEPSRMSAYVEMAIAQLQKALNKKSQHSCR